MKRNDGVTTSNFSGLKLTNHVDGVTGTKCRFLAEGVYKYASEHEVLTQGQPNNVVKTMP